MLLNSDARSIPLAFGSLFTGIGGIDLGFERAGMTCKWQCDNDDYCNKVLAKHWPDVRRYKDVKEIHGVFSHAEGDIRRTSRDERPKSLNWGGSTVSIEEGCPTCLPPVDVICGGFPCQPHSVAGKRRGAADDRNLWPEFLRIIREVRPTWVVAENVPGIVSLYIDQVLSDLEGEDYTCWTFNIPACAFDAPHRRERIFVVAHSNRKGKSGQSINAEQGQGELVADAISTTIGGRGIVEQSDRQGREFAQAERESLQPGYGQAYSSELEQGGQALADTLSNRSQGGGEIRNAQGQIGLRSREGSDQEQNVANSTSRGEQSGCSQRDERRFQETVLRTSRNTHDWTVEPGLGMLVNGISPWLVEPDIPRVATGVPDRVNKLRALGNAVVPQVAEWIGRRIVEAHAT